MKMKVGTADIEYESAMSLAMSMSTFRKTVWRHWPLKRSKAGLMTLQGGQVLGRQTMTYEPAGSSLKAETSAQRIEVNDYQLVRAGML